MKMLLAWGANVLAFVFLFSVVVSSLLVAAPSPKTQEALLRAAVEVAIVRIDEGHVEIARQVLIDVLEDTK